MAVADEVVVRLRADVDQYNASLVKASREFKARMAEMQIEAINAGNAVGIASGRAAAGLTNAGSAAGRAKPQFDNLGRSAGMARLQMQNLTFQTQDVIQQMVAGQPPLQLLGQQLFQITQYGGSLNGVMGALKNTVAGLFSPLGLATTAFVLLGSAAISYLTEIMSRGGQSNEELEKQAQRIQAIADKWGIAFPALKKYTDERERLKTIEDVELGRQQLRELTFEDITKQAKDLRLEITGIVSDLQQAGADQNQITALQRAFENLDKAVADQSVTAEDARRVQSELMSLYINTMIPGLDDAARTFDEYANSINKVTGATSQIDEQAAATKVLVDAMNGLDAIIGGLQSEKAQSELQKLADKAIEGEVEVEELKRALASLTNTSPDLTASISEFLRLIGVIRQAKQEAAGFTGRESQGGRVRYGTTGFMQLPSSPPTPTSRPMYEFEALPGTGRGGGGRGRKSEAEREAEAIAKLIDQLEFELEQVGKTDREKQVEANVRRLAASATEEQKDQVRELTGAIYDQKEAQDEANRAAKEFNDIGKQALSSFINDIRNGVSASEALANALDKVADKLLDIALDSMFSSRGGGGFGGILASIFGGFRANGGPVSGGKAYVVGERGPELFLPGQAGSIIPRVPNMSPSSQSGANVTINAPINAPGADPAALARVEQSVKELGRNIPKMVDNRVNVRQIRNVRA